MKPTSLNIGDKAPRVALPDETGKTVRLSDFAGKWVVAFFYPRANTSG